MLIFFLFFFFHLLQNLFSEKGYIPFHELNVCTVFNYKKSPTRFSFALRHKNYRPPARFANGTQVAPPGPESVYRILCTETSAERDSWMAALVRAKVSRVYFIGKKHKKKKFFSFFLLSFLLFFLIFFQTPFRQ